MTNKKQAIAIWGFGIVIAVGLLLTDHFIFALVVAGGLVIFGLRSKESSKAKPADHAQDEGPSKSNSELRNLTPHMFAAAIVQRMIQNEPPFDGWRPDPDEIPEYADAACELSSHAYQLKVLVDLLTRKFGVQISKLVETSLLSLLDKPDRKFFGPAFDKIVHGRSLGPVPFEDVPLDEDLRLDIQVADQILTLFSDEGRLKIRIALAQCLSLARVSADESFSDVAAQMEFNPVSVAFLERRDFYAGRRGHWSDTPGSFERHLQRREGNPMFVKEFRQPTKENIKAARAKDDEDFEAAEESALAWINEINKLGDNITVANIAPLHKTSSEVMETCAKAGGRAEAYRTSVRNIDEAVANQIIKAIEEILPQAAASLRASDKGWMALRDIAAQPFFAQMARKNGPISQDEQVAALLCESVQSVKDIVAIVKVSNMQDARVWFRKASVLADRARKAGFEIPALEKKLSALKSIGET